MLDRQFLHRIVQFFLKFTDEGFPAGASRIGQGRNHFAGNRVVLADGLEADPVSVRAATTSRETGSSSRMDSRLENDLSRFFLRWLRVELTAIRYSHVKNDDCS